MQTLYPDTITVVPDPRLNIKYFWQRRIYSDDPFTPEIEPPIPFNLAVMVHNSGYGQAFDVSIVSGQPEIIENEKGLLVNFEIINSRVGYGEVSPSLTVDLDTIQPQTTVTAWWGLTSTLQGEFRNFNATFRYFTPLGDPRLSVLESLEIYGLDHLVHDFRLEDDQPDALADEVRGWRAWHEIPPDHEGVFLSFGSTLLCAVSHTVHVPSWPFDSG